MTFLTEEQKEKLKKAGIKVPIINDSCIGCGACTAVASDVFDFDDENAKVFVKSDANLPSSTVDDAISICPVGAIEYDG